MNKMTIVNADLANRRRSSVSQELFNQLLNPTIDLSIDYSEIYLDDLIDNEAIQQIPIIKSIVGLIKGGISINQFWFAKKLLVFIQEFNHKTIAPEKLEKFKSKLDTDPKFRKKIAERLMIYIERNIEISQTLIITNLVSAYVEENISFDQLNNIIITLDKLNPKSYETFFDLEKIDFMITSTNHEGLAERNFEMESLITNSGFAIEPSPYFHAFALTEDGKALFKYGLKPIKKQ